MAQPLFVEWPVWVGNNDPVTLTLTDPLAGGAPLDLTGLIFKFSIVWDGVAIRMTSGVDAGLVIEDQTDAATKGQLTVTLSLEQTRDLPTLKPARLELECWDGAEQTSLLYGEVPATDWGVNLDA